jgi:hypothetical protein
MCCWGVDDNGDTTVPNQATTTWSSVAAADQHTCGVEETTGKMTCFGFNGEGQTNVPANSKWTSVFVGGQHTCGFESIAGTTKLRCFGWNAQGQCNVPAAYSA